MKDAKPTGEVCESCQPILIALQDRIAGLEHTLRSQASTIGRLKRDPEATARGHADWERCERLFRQWRRITAHPKSKFTVDRFNQAKPMLNAYEDELHIRAYLGAANDPYERRRANGTMQRFTGWQTIYKSADTFEEYANRAPYNAKDLIEDALAQETR